MLGAADLFGRRGSGVGQVGRRFRHGPKCIAARLLGRDSGSAGAPRRRALPLAAAPGPSAAPRGAPASPSARRPASGTSRDPPGGAETGFKQILSIGHFITSCGPLGSGQASPSSFRNSTTFTTGSQAGTEPRPRMTRRVTPAVARVVDEPARNHGHRAPMPAIPRTAPPTTCWSPGPPTSGSTTSTRPPRLERSRPARSGDSRRYLGSCGRVEVCEPQADSSLSLGVTTSGKCTSRLWAS